MRLSLLGLSLFFSLAIQAQTPNPAPKSSHRFLVSAHRGDHTHAPENTLRAYANAIGAGADYVEIDLRTTRDSVLVIMHDASVDRMTNGARQGPSRVG
jgi:glycerophosphoryl diester phosphodiesterase